MNWQDLPFIEKVHQNQQAFGEKVITIANDLDLLPEWLMCVMNNESGLDSTARNPYSSATGLIQFMDATATDLGTTTDELAAMTNIDQLDFVKLYFTKYGYYKHINDFGDLYLSMLYPLALYKDDSFMLPDWVTKANPTFDTNKDGHLTKAEFKENVTAKYANYLPADNSAEVMALQQKKKLNL